MQFRYFAPLLPLTSAVYLPGFAPNEYIEGDSVDLKVNKLTSVRTQLPYSYYTLPYCRPSELKDKVENLGETLMGDIVENSPYELKMNHNETCKRLCPSIPLKEADKENFKSKIEDQYVVNWIIDNLPVATRVPSAKAGSPGSETELYASGFPVGFLHEGRYYVYNHVKLVLEFHANPELYEGYRIVGAEVMPVSLATNSQGCGASAPFDLEKMAAIDYTYDVYFVYSDVRWASRWDAYLKMTGGQIHWFAIVNSLMILLLLSGMVATILLRTLHRDIAKYNELTTQEEHQEETGWKLVHADVFRKPRYATLLVVSVSSGVQILGMSIVTLIFALIGFITPARRGGLLQSVMLLFTLMGIVAGFCAGRMDKFLHGSEAHWKKTTLLTALFYPGIFFALFFVLNLFIRGQRSSGAVPFTTMFAVLTLWFGISVPLVLVGAYAGFSKEAIEVPVRTGKIPREVPAQDFYNKPIVTSLVGGLLPFGAVFTELYFIMSSLWQHQFYYLFGFLALVLAILLLTCAEVSIACTYFRLTTEDYHWWWPAFFTSGSSGIYVLLYALFYFKTRLQIVKFVSTLLYFGYMSMLSLLFGLLTGSIGLISSFFFVRGIYGSIKVD